MKLSFKKKVGMHVVFQILILGGRVGTNCPGEKDNNKKEKINVCFLQYLAANGKSLVIRVSQKNTFFEFRFGGRITGANGCPEATKNFSVIDP